MRGQGRIPPRGTSPASRLSPVVTPEAGNLDSLVQHHREPSVNQHIKISLYGYMAEASAAPDGERAVSSPSLQRQRRKVWAPSDGRQVNAGVLILREGKAFPCARARVSGDPFCGDTPQRPECASLALTSDSR